MNWLDCLVGRRFRGVLGEILTSSASRARDLAVPVYSQLCCSSSSFLNKALLTSLLLAGGRRLFWLDSMILMLL